MGVFYHLTIYFIVFNFLIDYYRIEVLYLSVSYRFTYGMKCDK